MPFEARQAARLDAARIAADERRGASEVAIGNRPADLVIVGGTVLDVHTGELRRADLAVAGARLAYVGDLGERIGADTEVLDVEGAVLVPAFLEPHLHVGGSQLDPVGLAEVLVARGTLGVTTDFYEVGTIAGPDGVAEMLTRAEGTGLDVFLAIFHACAMGFGQWGDLGRYTLDDLVALVDDPRVVEVREWNYGMGQIPLPLLGTVYEKVLEHDLVLSGHLEGLSGPVLQAAAALGVTNDHEVVDATQAVERARLGIGVQIREGSGAHDLVPVLEAITAEHLPTQNFCFSTDEQELSSLWRDGHMDHKLRVAVAHGLGPVEAVRMATLHAAQQLGVTRDWGALTPGRLAGIVALGDLRSFDVTAVVSRGRVAARDGEYLLGQTRTPYRTEWTDTVSIGAPITADTFAFDRDLAAAKMRVIGVAAGSLVTEELVEIVRLDQGALAPGQEDLVKLAMIDRHGGDHIGVAVARGLGIERGAVATTINPGMMNLMVIGPDDADMALAASRVVELGGGIVVALDGEIRAEVATPLFGIMSPEPASAVAEACCRVADALVDDLGSSLEGLVTQAGFACLAVSIPNLKLSDRGLVRVDRLGGQEAVDLIVDRDVA